MFDLQARPFNDNAIIEGTHFFVVTRFLPTDSEGLASNVRDRVVDLR